MFWIRSKPETTEPPTFPAETVAGNSSPDSKFPEEPDKPRLDYISMAQVNEDFDKCSWTRPSGLMGYEHPTGLAQSAQHRR